MEENFDPVARTRANYYTPGSPVQFVCVELLKGEVSGEHAVCLTFKNIPRTLNMAMSGIRDLSTIEQPPIERQPVETFVLEYNDVILAEAMKKELARGGQVYYLHNRRLVHHNLVIADDDGVGGAKVHCYLLYE